MQFLGMCVLAQKSTMDLSTFSLSEEMNLLVREAMEKTGSSREEILQACLEQGLAKILAESSSATRWAEPNN
jgi:L-serine deaminase